MHFLSYASTNSTEAVALASGLRALGMSIWCAEDRTAIAPGAAFQSEIERRLLESNTFLLLVGQRGVDRWVRLEVDAALARHVREPSYRIVPLLLAEVAPESLPPFLARFHREQLVGEVTRWGPRDFDALTQRLQLSRELQLPEGSPFPGLETFEERNTCFFFGRDNEIREALRDLGQVGERYRRWLHIEGPSGTGKSSFARAGIVPAVRLGWIEGGLHSWRVAVFRPGRYPLQRLAKALTDTFGQRDHPGRLTEMRRALELEQGLRDFVTQGLRDGEGLLLVIDQLEELLTSADEPDGESRMLRAAVACALKADNGLHLVTTFRSDFATRLHELGELGSLLNTHAVRYFLAPMKPEAIRAAIEGPSSVAKVEWEEGLRERLLEDAGRAAESLPLMAHILHEVWKRRAGSLMTHTAYEALGGVGGAISQSADYLLDSLSKDEQLRARVLLTSLVRVGRGSRDARRVLTREEAIHAAGGEANGGHLIGRLSGTHLPGAPPGVPAPPRLLSASADRVDLVHEALIDRWGTLQAWINEDRQLLERIDDTEHAARGWVDAGKPSDGLPGGTFLAFYLGSGLAMPEALRQRLTPDARQFVDAAVAKDRERRQLIAAAKAVIALAMIAFYGWHLLDLFLGEPQKLFTSFGWGQLLMSAENVALTHWEEPCNEVEDSMLIGSSREPCLAEVKSAYKLEYEFSRHELWEKGRGNVRLELVKPFFLPGVSVRSNGMSIYVDATSATFYRIILRDREAKAASYICTLPAREPITGPRSAVFGISYRYIRETKGVIIDDFIRINLDKIESIAIEVPILTQGASDDRSTGESGERHPINYKEDLDRDQYIRLKGIRLGLLGANTTLCEVENPGSHQ